MSHNVGRMVTFAPIRIGPDGTGAAGPGVWEHNVAVQPALVGGTPRFVILHLTALALPGASRVEVDLGYATDVFTSASGTDVWTRLVDPQAGTVTIRYLGPGPAGGVTFAEYGSGEPWTTTYPPASDHLESTTNADLFLHTSPYAEPTYQTWLRCGGTFDWQNAACLPGASVQEETARAVCMIVSVHGHAGDQHVSTCTGTLIDTNLVLTARHCLDDPGDLEIRSGSVTFDYLTACNGTRPGGYAPFFHKIRRAVAQGAAPEAWVPNSTDWLILEIDPLPAGRVPRPLRGTPVMAGEPVFTVHHPNGAVKKTQSGPLSGNTVANVQGFDYGGGSSGSALFDAQGRVIGAALSSAASAPNVCNVGYTPAPNVLAALANPPAPAAPYDLMLVIDRSGSMTEPGTSGPTKMDDAREAASLFVQLVRLNAGDKLGMVSFATTASNPVDEPPGNVNPGKKMQLVGPSPYTGGEIGNLTAGGATSIGGGLQAAVNAMPAPGGNQRAIVLMTDGMQNTAPSIEAVEPALASTRLCVVGFGQEWQLDGPLLDGLARRHNGLYTRAHDGLALKKFFALCFGNIFEAGMLADPERVLKASADEDEAMTFPVCDEDVVTVVLMWDDPSVDLLVALFAPSGAEVDLTAPGIVTDVGRTWSFARVPLPVNGEREGTWRVVVRRPEVLVRLASVAASGPQRGGDARYLVSVLADGGPLLRAAPAPRHAYTGDRITPRVVLQYPNGTAPYGRVTLTVERPDGSLGALVQQSGLAAPIVAEEAVDAFTATLRKIADSAGGTWPVGTVTETYELFDDGGHDDGAMDRDGVWGVPLADLFRHEGNYTFHAVADYGDDCPGRREATWSVHVEPGVDPGRTDVTLVDRGTNPDGSRTGVITVRPRDKYGNPLGPGRGPRFEVAGQPGTTVVNPPHDNGDGSYDVAVQWGPGPTGPGVVVNQPGRYPAPLTPDGGGLSRGCLVQLLVLLAVLVVLLAVALVIALT